jgi:hypothetical protein
MGKGKAGTKGKTTDKAGEKKPAKKGGTKKK